MNDQEQSGQPLDPRLKELLGLLKETPPRDPEAEAHGRARFLAEVDQLFSERLSSEPTRPIAHKADAPAPEAKRSGWWRSLASLQPRLAFTSLMAILAIVLLLFGGAGATAFAAQAALPGDALYPLKTSLESTQVRLSRDAARQAQLHLDFAERRLDEIAALIAEGRFDSIGTATQEFETHVQQAINALETVSAGDPQRAKTLAIQISSALSRYAQILRDMLVQVPDPIKPDMEKALLTSEEKSGEIDLFGTVEGMAADGITINGKFVKINNLTEIKGALAVGAQVNVHALQGPDGALIAREIEVTASVEVNANENENFNLNDNQGGENLNENEVEDNLNENEGQDLNLNENEGEDLENLNENHNDNENGNMNMNENDDHENDNAGSNQNYNDNGGGDHENSNYNDNGGSNRNDNEHENDNGGSENKNTNDND